MAYILYLFVNAGIAILNRDEREHNLRHRINKQINHFIWGGIYIALMIPAWFIIHSWWFILAITLQHLWFFAPLFNILIGMPVFNLSKTSSALTDRALVALGFKSTEKVILATFIISVVLLIKSF